MLTLYSYFFNLSIKIVRQNSTKVNCTPKYEMTFGFDIEKGTFLKLFEVVHYNTVGILREYPNLGTRLETELKDTVILSLV